MLLLLAVILAIPTWGVSLIVYFVWAHHVKKRAHPGGQNLSKVDLAILLVARKHNGSIIGTSVEGITFHEVTTELMSKMLFEKASYGQVGHAEEAQISLAGTKYDVHVSREPNGGNDAIFRVRKSEKWLDEVYALLAPDRGYNSTISKYFLPFEKSIVLGSATLPEWRPKDVTIIPAGIGYLADLETLGLINQNVASLPDSLRKLRSLRQLKLGGNSLTKFPAQVFDMPNLEVLTLWCNDIRELPEDIGKLVTLTGLDISYNNFTCLPDSITNLTRLRKFYMSHDGTLELTRAQKIWLVELIRNGAEVVLNEEVRGQLVQEFPELGNIVNV